MANKEIIKILDDWETEIGEHHQAPYYDDQNEPRIPSEVLQQILSQMDDAWAVIDRDGNVDYDTIAERKKSAIRLFTGVALCWDSLKEKGYTVKKIKYVVCDE